MTLHTSDGILFFFLQNIKYHLQALRHFRRNITFKYINHAVALAVRLQKNVLFEPRFSPTSTLIKMATSMLVHQFGPDHIGSRQKCHNSYWMDQVLISCTLITLVITFAASSTIWSVSFVHSLGLRPDIFTTNSILISLIFLKY